MTATVPLDEVYATSNIKRIRATRAEMEARYDALYDIVAESQPTGIRFVYYRAVAAGLVPKTQNGYIKVQRAILDMRRDDALPWPWIVDNTRWMHKPRSWDSVDDALADIGASYRKALWRDSPAAVEVWCESDSIAGVLYPTTAKWDVPLYPVRGQTSDSFVWRAAQTYKHDPRRLVIFYVGDHDPAGYEIESNLEAKLIEHSERDDIEFTRLACDAQDVERLGLVGTKPKKNSWINAITGERTTWRGPAVEVEAIDAPTLRSWLEEWILHHVDQDALRLHKIAEQNERDLLLALAGQR